MTAGQNTFEIVPGETLDDLEAYTVALTLTPDPDPVRDGTDDLIDDGFVDLAGTGFALSEAGINAFVAFEEGLSAVGLNVGGNSTAILDGVGSRLGPAAEVLDAVNRAENITNAADPGRQLYIELADFRLAAGITVFASSATAVAAAVTGTVLAPLVVPAVGIGSGLIYTFGFASAVRAVSYTHLTLPTILLV